MRGGYDGLSGNDRKLKGFINTCRNWGEGITRHQPLRRYHAKRGSTVGVDDRYTTSNYSDSHSLLATHHVTERTAELPITIIRIQMGKLSARRFSYNSPESGECI